MADWNVRNILHNPRFRTFEGGRSFFLAGYAVPRDRDFERTSLEFPFRSRLNLYVGHLFVSSNILVVTLSFRQRSVPTREFLSHHIVGDPVVH